MLFVRKYNIEVGFNGLIGIQCSRYIICSVISRFRIFDLTTVKNIQYNATIVFRGQNLCPRRTTLYNNYNGHCILHKISYIIRICIAALNMTRPS